MAGKRMYLIAVSEVDDGIIQDLAMGKEGTLGGIYSDAHISHTIGKGLETEYALKDASGANIAKIRRTKDGNDFKVITYLPATAKDVAEAFGKEERYVRKC